MKQYTVYLPSHTHDPLEIGRLTYQPTSNTATFKRPDKSDLTYRSMASAMDGIKQIYPSAFIEED